ncbi:RNA polymerase II subunit 5-mediating protein homolog isoform X1 [Fagus crenata]
MEDSAKKGKGTVTSLAAMFPAEDTQKAARRVQDKLAEMQPELDRVRGFISDNTNLINLVQKLPEDLHHDIMVPFGKAAFFPGRLIHTNEVVVLLGEGYYAERTSKQTVEILKRRGKELDSQVESLKAMMRDLKAETSFFDATASEAMEGLVEIREDYVEENSTESESESGPPKEDAPSFSEADKAKVAVEDDYARIMSRMDELEIEELEEECGSESVEYNEKVAINDEEYARIMSRLDELEKEELEAENDNDSDEKIKADFGQLLDQKSLDTNLRYSEDYQSRKLLEQTKDKKSATEEFLDECGPHQDLTDQLNCMGLTVQSVSKDEKSHGKSLAHNVIKSNPPEKALMLPAVKENVQPAPSSRSEVPVHTSNPGFDGHKAFTGSIIERTQNIQTNSSKESATSSLFPTFKASFQVQDAEKIAANFVRIFGNTVGRLVEMKAVNIDKRKMKRSMSLSVHNREEVKGSSRLGVYEKHKFDLLMYLVFSKAKITFNEGKQFSLQKAYALPG